MGECSAKLNRKWLLSWLMAVLDFLKTFLDVPLVVVEDLISSLEVVPDADDPKKKSSLAFFNWFALGDNNDSVDDGRCSKLEKKI